MANHVLGVQMSPEHIERNAKVNPKEAIKELIWNACDADATSIEITLSKTHDDYEAIEEIIIIDNGHGLDYEDISDFLGFYGRSNKTYSDRSPSGRLYHGKQGHGRYKSFSIGPRVKWENVYIASDGKKYRYSIEFFSGNKTECSYSDKVLVSDSTDTGMVVSITGITDNLSVLSNTDKMSEDIVSSFAAYLLAYSNIKIKYDSYRIDPKKFIQEQVVESIESIPDNKERKEAEVNIILWKEGFQKESSNLFICGKSGVTYDALTVNPKNHPISVYIQSDVFDQMHQQGTLSFGVADPYYESFVTKAKQILRDFIDNKFRIDAIEEVRGIKNTDIYPYLEESSNPIETVERQYFDVLAVEINSIIPSFRNASNETKKLTYRLMKEAVKTKPDSLTTILSEVFRLTQEEQEKLASLLSHTTLPSIINMTQTITNRLLFVQALEQMVYNTDVGNPIRERTQFHKILLGELWVFGEKYTLGVSDVSLKNVLVKYLSKLGRTELVPTIPNEAETHLNKIPDLCLWNQYPVQDERIENLVIELKRPTHKLKKKDLDQIKGYAFAVSNDPIFPKENTKWNFILLGREYDDYVVQELKDKKSGAGNYYNSDDGTISISVFRWSKIIQENKLRFNFLKDKLDFSLENSDQALDYLNETYATLFDIKIPISDEM